MSISIANVHSLRNYRDSRRVRLKLANEPKNWEKTIAELLDSPRPLLYGRLGGVEAIAIGIYLDELAGLRNPIRLLAAKIYKGRRMAQLCNNAGVYPITKEVISFFCEQHLKALEMVDILSVWAKPMAWVEANYSMKAEVTLVPGDASFPWPEPRDGISERSWGSSLDGKRVLVVSPFIDTFEIQVQRLNRIFEGIDTPKMNLDFVRAPLSQGGLEDGKTYANHLNRLKKDMDNIEFDIALISAGAYSLPLAAHAKSLGKKGIHAGGALQTFFGVSGNRYDSYPWVQKFANPNWRRPSIHERPRNWKSIEDGCYW